MESIETRSGPAVTRRNLLTAAALFTIVFGLHAAWYLARRYLSSAEWVTVGPERGVAGWLSDYFREKHVFMGYSYALAAAFTALVLLQFFKRTGGSAVSAAGGLTVGSIFAALGCFLSGCCGSPMLAVYISLFGARIAGFTQLLVAGLTTVSVAVSWYWLVHRHGKSCRNEQDCRSQPV